MWCFDHLDPTSMWHWDLEDSNCHTLLSNPLSQSQWCLTQQAQLELDGCMHMCMHDIYHALEKYFEQRDIYWPGDARKVAICCPRPLHTICFAPTNPGWTYSCGSAKMRILPSTSAKGVDGPTSTVNNIPGSVTCQVTCPIASSEQLMQFFTPGVMNLKMGSLLVIVKLASQPTGCWASPILIKTEEETQVGWIVKLILNQCNWLQQKQYNWFHHSSFKHVWFNVVQAIMAIQQLMKLTSHYKEQQYKHMGWGEHL